MKRVVLLLSMLVVAASVVAQSADSVAFVSARRQKLKLKNAEGYTVSTTLFSSAQYISVIKFSPERFAISITQPEILTRVSEIAEGENAQFAINAGFWNRNQEPSTYVKSKGVELSLTHPGLLPRVNGVMLMRAGGIEIIYSEDAPYYSSLTDKIGACENVLACGPVLIDDGRRLSYDYVITSTDSYLKRRAPFFTRRHPRSVIGRDVDGNIYLVVVDGRAAGRAEGMSIDELTQLCSWMGMYEAMNLDGGGSSTLWSRKYGVINHPCDNKVFDHEGERKVSSVLVIKAKKSR